MTAAITPPQRILLVEDSETQALQIRLVLEAHGFAVERHATAEGALESLNERLPDLVIADYHLPGMNGDELSRQMRLNVQTRAIPVLMLTEARTPELERQGLESGADAYVPKSADQDLIVLRIKALLRQHGSRGSQGEAGRRDGASPRFTPFRRAHILVVDESPTYRAYLTNLFAQEGHAVEVCSGPDEALAAVVKPGAVWDCVIVDVMGRSFDGIALCRRLDAVRADAMAPAPEVAPFQIVGLGSEWVGGKDLLVHAFAAGADDVVPKKVDDDVLSVRVRTMVRRKLLQDENRRIDAELRDREIAIERARAEAAAAEAKAALAEALAQANQDLEDANRRLRETQTKLVQAAKMASLGELVAGIAHEINNPLAFILAHQGTVERLLADLDGQCRTNEEAARSFAKARERVGSMRLGLTRIQDLVRNLRRFSRFDEGEFQTVRVEEAVETVLALMAHKLGERISVVRRYDAVPDLFCSPALLNQVVMNIIGNAADAIPDTGTITIQTASDADSYTIAICDSGPGIPEPLRERIFEPFFTTKPVGSGTGLGLAIAYSVVQAHKGTITVEAGSNGGACFVVTVPRHLKP